MSEQRFVQALSRRACVALLLGAACAFAPGAFAAGPTAPMAPVSVSDAWIRWLPAGLPAGGYMRLHNDGAHMVALISASSADYGEVMLHRSEMNNGTMNMLPVDKVEIPAHGNLAFQPGGYHIMLMHPRKPVSPGQQVPITLKFSDGSTLEVPFEVRKPGASDTPHGGMHGMTMKSGS